WIATGSMVPTALTVSKQWPGSAVWSAPSLKPIDEVQVAVICRRHLVVVVMEEHSVYGGLGSAVTEIASAQAPTWVCRVGIRDRFSRCCGSYGYLLSEHQLDAAAVQGQVERFVGRLANGMPPFLAPFWPVPSAA